MAAKNKPTGRVRSADSAARDVTGLHLRASQHRDDLIEEARSLMSAGRVREARAVEKRAAQVEQLLGAIECEARPPASLAKN